MLRIAITGPESSGKTELAKDLANHFNVDYVPEFAREYLLNQNGEYNFDDLEKIAIGQLDSFDSALHQNYLIADTEMLVLYIWSQVRFGKVSPIIEQALHKQHFDLYLLCDIDIPWEYDPLRENEFDRDDLFQLYYKKMRELKLNFIHVKGSPQERLNQSVQIIEQILVQQKNN